MEYTLYNIFASAITATGAFASLLLAVSIFRSKKGIRKSNMFLAGIFLIMSIRMLDNFIVYSGLYAKIPHSIFFTYPFSFVIDPLFFFYVLIFLKPKRTFKWYDLFHLSLFVYLWWGGGHLDFMLSPSSYKLSRVNDFMSLTFSMKSIGVILVTLKLFVLVGYITYISVLLKKEKNNIRLLSPNTSLNYTSKLYNIIYIYVGIAIFSTVLLFFLHFLNIRIIYVELAIFLQNSILLISLAVWHSNKSEILVFEKPKKIKTKRIPEISSQLFDLHSYMLNKKPFLNPDLKLTDLAGEIKMPVRKLSTKINNEFEMSFYDFINHYRIEEFKDMINSKKNEQLTLLAIALEAGFNSKSSFNRVFKNHTGQTPSQFVTLKKVSTL